MRLAPRRIRGFTLIELMVTLTVIVVLTLIALPSFRTFQQRSALRGAADQVQSLWNQSRFEAAKRNTPVKFGIKTGTGTMCIGASTDVSDVTTPCDCFTANACDVLAWPTDQAEWRDVTINGTPTLGSNNGVAVIDPKRTALTDSAMAGVIALKSPSGPRDYRLNVRVDALGRAITCESSAAPAHMSDFQNITCSP